MRVGDRDRSFEHPAFLHPRRPGHLAVAVQREPCGKHRIRVGLAARKHHRHTGAHRALSDDQLAVAGNQGGLPDLDAGNVADRVQRSRGPANRQVEVALAGLLRPRRKRKKDDEERGDTYTHHTPADILRPIGAS